MTGLNLELFLRLLRADLGAWVSFGVIVLILALMTWTSWGSRKILRKCLVVSIFAHIGLVLYGSTLPLLRSIGSVATDESEPKPTEHIQRIQVTSIDGDPIGPQGSSSDRSSKRPGRWDRPSDPATVAEVKRQLPARPDRDSARENEPKPERTAQDLLAMKLAEIEPSLPSESAPSLPERRNSKPDTQTSPPKPEADPNVVNGEAPERPATDRATDRSPAPPLIAEQRLRPARVPVESQNAPATVAPKTKPVRSVDRRGPLVGDLAGNAPLPLDSEAQAKQKVIGSAAGANAGDPSAATAGKPVKPVTGELGSMAATVRAKPKPSPEPAPPLAEADLRVLARSAEKAGQSDQPMPKRSKTGTDPVAIARATPNGVSPLPDVTGVMGGRPLTDIPEVYRSRLDPDRTALARKAGATQASEQAVERALDWLARHQDADGRWNGGALRSTDGQFLPGQFDFTFHCPPGEVCAGPCFYAEADTAMTGLALLAFLGAGYTHIDGKYADAVGNGIEFLRFAQKPDGSLRGESRSVGMYCHAMATLAMCEAFALTGDERLRDPVTRAVQYIIKGRSSGGVGWRYQPGSPDADTSVLGWVVMVLKSASEVGIDVPTSSRQSALGWLDRVALGDSGGLAVYMPGHNITPTMTAEAWVCRQFLGVGGPGAASREAARYLLDHGPDRVPYNLYYWYYGTIAMYQHGGSDWSRWNSVLRDRLVDRQLKTGHRAGSWDRDEDTTWGIRGGRIYTTTMATLTLEVYYRYLRLYDANPPTRLAPAPRPSDSGVRRTGVQKRPATPKRID